MLSAIVFLLIFTQIVSQDDHCDFSSLIPKFRTALNRTRNETTEARREEIFAESTREIRESVQDCDRISYEPTDVNASTIVHLVYDFVLIHHDLNYQCVEQVYKFVEQKFQRAFSRVLDETFVLIAYAAMGPRAKQFVRVEEEIALPKVLEDCFADEDAVVITTTRRPWWQWWG